MYIFFLKTSLIRRCFSQVLDVAVEIKVIVVWELMVMSLAVRDRVTPVRDQSGRD